MVKFDPSILVAGDVILYGGNDFVDQIIQLKTWSNCAHIEIALDKDFSIASRNGIGVSKYPHRSKGLRYVLRPNTPLDFINGMNWFNNCADGKPYGFADLLGFASMQWLETWVRKFYKKEEGLICSEFAALFFDNSAAPMFSQKYNRGIICPRDFLITPRLDLIWDFANKNST